MDPNLFVEVAPFEVEMRYVYVEHYSPYQGTYLTPCIKIVKFNIPFKVQLKVMPESTLHLGLCLPKSCTNGQIYVLLQDLFTSKEIKDELKLQLNVLRVKDLQLDQHFFSKSSVLLFMTAVFVINFLNRYAIQLDEKEKVLENNKIAIGLENKREQSSFQKAVQCFNLKQPDNIRFSVLSISGLKQVF